MHGVILGTAAYMSPEQAKGRTVDKRADIWAFGCVLYEMLSGTPLFDGETASETIADVLRKPIDLRTLPSSTPAHVRRVIERCLERDPRNRLRDIGDARVALETAPSASAVGAAVAATPAPPRLSGLWRVFRGLSPRCWPWHCSPSGGRRGAAQW